MDDAILTFSAPTVEPGRVEAGPSAVLELAYAAYVVTKRGVPPAPGPALPAWFRRLAQEAPEALGAVAGFWAARGSAAPSVEAFVLAGRFGYARDDDPERFLTDLPSLAERFLADERSMAGGGDQEAMARLRGRLEQLREAPTARAWTAAHRGLWRLLTPVWAHEGRSATEAAAAAFLAAYRSEGSVLAALPPHHFIQFEAAAQAIRKAESDGRVFVVPLGLAVAGGFQFDVGGTLFIGYGLQAERVHERAVERVAELAGRMKVFADPTRAMLLSLIGRFAEMSMTVGDLALQLGVSQPTVSGHLRLLREAGLVHLDRRGTKAYHRLDTEALRSLLEAFQDAVLERDEPDAGVAP